MIDLGLVIPLFHGGWGGRGGGGTQKALNTAFFSAPSLLFSLPPSPHDFFPEKGQRSAIDTLFEEAREGQVN